MTSVEPGPGSENARWAAWRVPAELAMLIFEEADKSSLLTCSLASRTWFRLARPSLFKTAAWRLRPHHFWVPAGDGTEAGGAPPLGGLECLRRFLQNNPDVCPLIQDLTVGFERPPTPHAIDWAAILRRPGAQACQLETLAEILGILQNLHTLKIDNVPFDATYFEPYLTLPPLSAPPVSLRRLEVSSWQTCRRSGTGIQYDVSGWSSEAQLRLFYHFIGHFEEIQEVVLEDVRIPRVGVVVGLAGGAVEPLLWHLPVKIHTLTVTNIIAFSGLSPLQRVDNLAFPAPAMGKPLTLIVCPDMLTTLAGVRHHLRRVMIDIDGHQLDFHSEPLHRRGHIPTVRLLQLAITAMTALETLSLCATLRYRLSDDGRLFTELGMHWRTYDFAVRMVRVLPHSVRTFVLLLRFEETRESAEPLALDWSHLDLALAESIGGGLQKVEFADLDRQPLSDYERGLLRARMPMTWSTGAVQGH
ncbi:hypothetical protein PsYK624_035460 [Phanerochaete sordida]|uniref:F-box domain-containing protein n=1 Tax=Phanerochaete sordida TaxID=48140 RepID=A0A9P3LAZ0_9APHY|nr:hypothetical protein PsYK624_035460 [Phanerochaete sordida]